MLALYLNLTKCLCQEGCVQLSPFLKGDVFSRNLQKEAMTLLLELSYALAVLRPK